MPGVVPHLIVGAVAALATAAATPMVRRFAIGSGLVVAPDERNVHTAPTPSLGGTAMLVGLLAGNGRDVGQVARNRLLGLGMIQNMNGTHSLRRDWR